MCVSPLIDLLHHRPIFLYITEPCFPPVTHIHSSVWTNVKWCGPDNSSPFSVMSFFLFLSQGGTQSQHDSHFEPHIILEPQFHCIQRVQELFEPNLRAAERTDSLAPNRLVRPEETGEEERDLLLPVRCDQQTGMACSRRERQCCHLGQWKRHLQMRLLRRLSLGNVVSGCDPDTGIDVKFHYQLHFKSYMYVPGHD